MEDMQILSNKTTRVLDLVSNTHRLHPKSQPKQWTDDDVMEGSLRQVSAWKEWSVWKTFIHEFQGLAHHR
jgi:hypothetical protein